MSCEISKKGPNIRNDSKQRHLSRPKGGVICGSWRHDKLSCPYEDAMMMGIHLGGTCTKVLNQDCFISNGLSLKNNCNKLKHGNTAIFLRAQNITKLRKVQFL